MTMKLCCAACILTALFAALPVEATHVEDPSSPLNGRELQENLADMWAISLVHQEKRGDYGVTLTYTHGNGGIPDYKIYGKDGFDEMAPGGETCRSQGGGLQLGYDRESCIPPGMTVALENYNENTESVLSIDIDKDGLAPALMRQSGDITVIQYCVLFFLKNDGGEEATILEAEIRVKLVGQEGSISVGKFESTRAEPLQKEFETSVIIEASLCNPLDAPSGQGSIVSICLACNHGSFKIESVTEFFFESVGTEKKVTQVAFQGGEAKALTAGEASTMDGTYKFDTILKAEFYQEETIEVIGAGFCKLVPMPSPGRNLQLNHHRIADYGGRPHVANGGISQEEDISSSTTSSEGAEEEENVAVSLAFVIGSDGSLTLPEHNVAPTASTTSLLSPTQSSDASPPSTTTIVSLIVALTAGLLSLVSIGLHLFGSRDPTNRLADGDKVITEDEPTESCDEVPLDHIQVSKKITWV